MSPEPKFQFIWVNQLAKSPDAFYQQIDVFMNDLNGAFQK